MRSFPAPLRPAADVDVTLTGSTEGTWGESNLATTPALTAAQAGKIQVEGKVRVEAITDSTGGGDRYMSEIVLLRNRGSVSTVLERAMHYGPRNLGTNAANTSDAWADASQITDLTLTWEDEDGQAGDTYTVQGRCLTQIETGSREVRFIAARSGIVLTAA